MRPSGRGIRCSISDSASNRVFFINGVYENTQRIGWLLYGPWGMAVNPVTGDIYVALALGTDLVAITP